MTRVFALDRGLDRGPYVLASVVLFAVKHNLDRFVAMSYFGRRARSACFSAAAVTRAKSTRPPASGADSVLMKPCRGKGFPSYN